MHGRLMLALAGDTALTAADEDTLAHPAVGGVILFARNGSGGSRLRQLTAAIRRAANRPLVIATDHEGGRVQRFRGEGFTHVPAMARIAAAPDADALAHAAGVVLAAELLAHGVDMTFAPVLDILHGDSEVIGDRAFSGDSGTVGRLSRQVAAGLNAAGMIACGKHFPGHGYVAGDSHTELPVDSRSRAQMQDDIAPFAMFAEQGGELLMTAHIIYEQIDDKPATFSKRWLGSILRDELGYRGRVVSDDLCMQGAVEGAVEGNMAARLRAAAEAGCDLLLLCNPQDNAAALAGMSAMSAMSAKPDAQEGGASWQEFLRHDTRRITVGDAAYEEARQRLAALR